MQALRWTALLAVAVGTLFAFRALLTETTGEPETTGVERTAEEETVQAQVALRGATTGDGALPEGTAQVRGVVVGSDGRGLEGIRVMAYRSEAVASQGIDRSLDEAFRPPSSHTVYAETRSGADGSFTLGGLHEETSYAFTATPSPPGVGAARTGSPSRLAGTPLRLRVVEGSRLRGRVVDAEGRGLRAWLTLRLYSGEFAWRPGVASFHLVDRATDEDGRFVLPAVPAGRGVLYVRIPGRIARSFPVRLPRFEELVITLLEADGVAIAGTVRQTDGTPVPEAQVEITLASEARHGVSSATAMATTGDDGRYAASGLPPVLLGGLKVRAPGYRIGVVDGGRRPLEAGAVETIDIVLSRGARLEGIVLDPAGAPLADVALRARVDTPSSFRNVSVTTNVEGRYALPCLPSGRHALHVHKDGWYLPTQRDGRIAGSRPSYVQVTLEGEDTVTTCDVQLAPGVVLEGRCVTTGGAVLSGVRIVARPRTGGLFLLAGQLASTPPEVSSDAEGRFTFPGLAPHVAWDFAATAAGWRGEAALEAPLVPGEPRRTLEIVLRAMASITGRVETNAGALPVGERLRVTLRPGSRGTYVGVDGRFAFADLEPGPYALRASATFGADLGEALDVAVATGETADVVLRVPAPFRVAGDLVDAASKPVPGQGLGIRRTDQTWYGGVPAVTDAEGRFSVLVWFPGECEALCRGRRLGGTFPAGTTDLRLVYEEEPPVAEISIRIEDAEGRLVPRLRMLVTRTGRGQRTSWVREVVGGRLRLERSRLLVRTDLRFSQPCDEAWLPLNARPATLENVQDRREAEIVVRLEAGAVLRGRVLDASGAAVVGMRIGVGDQDGSGAHGRVKTDTAGRFEIPGLDPRASVYVHTHTEAPWLPRRPVRVASFEDEVELRVERGLPLVVRVLDPGAEPLEGVAVTLRGAWQERPWSRYDTTDGRGEVRLDGVPAAASFDVGLRPPSPGPPFPAQSFPGRQRGDGLLVFRVAAGVEIRGEVVDEQGLALAMATVRAEGLEENADAGATVTLEGKRAFVLENLRAGPYRITAEAGEGSEGSARSMYVDVTAPANGVRLVVGRAVTAEGSVPRTGAFPQVSVQWFARDQEHWSDIDQEGRFVFRGLRDEAGTLYVRRDETSDACFLREDVLPSEGPFAVRFVEGRQVRGRIVGSGDPADSEVTLALQRGPLHVETDPEEDGSFAFRAVPPGLYTLLVWRASRVVARHEGIEAGRTDVVIPHPTTDR